MESMRSDCLQPFDIASDPPFDILDDSSFQTRLTRRGQWDTRRCLVCAALQRIQRAQAAQAGAQSPIRTPQHMDGVPSNSPAEQAKVDASTEIHSRSRQVLRAAREAGSQTGMEQPPSSPAWRQEDNITFLREVAAHCAHVAACQHGMDF